MKARRINPIVGVIALVLLLSVAVVNANEVEVWTWWDISPEDHARMEAAVGAKVNFRNVPWGEFQEKLLVGVLGGSAPDMIYVDSQWFDDFALKGALTDLTPYMQRNPTGLPLDDIFPAAYLSWQDASGRQVAMPNTASPSVWWYNRDMFRELGLPELDESFDWDQWFEYARRASRDLDGDGLDDRKGLMDWYSDIANLIWSNGGEIFVDGEIAIDNPAAREAITFYKEFYERELVVSWDELAHIGFPQDPEAAWRNGVVAFVPGGDWVGPATVCLPDTECAFDIGVAHVPLAPSGGRVGLVRGNGLAIPAGAKNPDLGWRVIAYLLDDENAAREANNGQMPSRISIAASDEYLPPGKFPWSKKTIVDSMAYQRPADPGVVWSLSYAIWNSPIKAELARFYANQAGLAEVMENITVQVTNLLRELRANQ